MTTREEIEQRWAHEPRSDVAWLLAALTAAENERDAARDLLAGAETRERWAQYEAARAIVQRDNFKEIWEQSCAHVAEACAMLGADPRSTPADTWTLREWCARVVKERSEALAEAAKAQFKADNGELLARLEDKKGGE